MSTFAAPIEDSLLVTAPGGAAVSLPLTGVDFFEVSLGRKPPSRAPARLGFALGLVLGGTVGGLWAHEAATTPEGTGIAIGAALGAATGWAVGRLLARVGSKEVWEEIPVDKL